MYADVRGQVWSSGFGACVGAVAVWMVLVPFWMLRAGDGAGHAGLVAACCRLAGLLAVGAGWSTGGCRLRSFKVTGVVRTPWLFVCSSCCWRAHTGRGWWWMARRVLSFFISFLVVVGTLAAPVDFRPHRILCRNKWGFSQYEISWGKPLSYMREPTVTCDIETKMWLPLTFAG